MSIGPIGQPEKHPQVQDRRWRVYTDIHGRKWGAPVSKKTDAPVAPLRPRGWQPPVKGGEPPQRYLRISQDPENMQALAIDYHGIESAYRDSYEEWMRELHRQGRKMLKSAFDPANPSDEVLEVVGPQPFPWQYWRACRDEAAEGHAWALGLSDERPSWADQYFPRPVDAAAFLYADKTAEPVKKRAAAAAAR